jgi:hypothetical protein
MEVCTDRLELYLANQLNRFSIDARLIEWLRNTLLLCVQLGQANRLACRVGMV